MAFAFPACAMKPHWGYKEAPLGVIVKHSSANLASVSVCVISGSTLFGEVMESPLDQRPESRWQLLSWQSLCKQKTTLVRCLLSQAADS